MRKSIGWHVSAFFLFLAAAAAPFAAASARAQKIILDTDPGTDDAAAILLALNSPELDVKAVTVVAGNVTEPLGLENALKLVSLAKRCDVPVAGGAEHGLIQKLVTAEFFHGENGLGNVELPAAACKADARFAPDLIISLVHQYPHEITLVPVGPLTNIALAIAKDPTIVPLVKAVVLMGGSITGGNATAVAEANILHDPEAAQMVFNAGWPLTMVGLNVTEQTILTRAHLTEMKKAPGPQNDALEKILDFRVRVPESLGEPGTPLHDPLAVGAVIDPSLISTRDMRVDVETRGEFTQGETVTRRHNTVDHRKPKGDHFTVDNIERVPPNVHVAAGVNANRFFKLFIARLAGK